jgi:hypothetical protein
MYSAKETEVNENKNKKTRYLREDQRKVPTGPTGVNTVPTAA